MTDTAPTAPASPPLMSYDAFGHPVPLTPTPAGPLRPVIPRFRLKRSCRSCLSPESRVESLSPSLRWDCESEPVCQVRVQVSAAGFDHEGAFKVMQTRLHAV